MVIGGRYWLEKRIGIGGFATVWSARHLGTGQRVAIKIRLGPEQTPAARAQHSAVVRQGRMIVFGGESGSSRSDLWSLALE
jgi:hypothetical protein